MFRVLAVVVIALAFGPVAKACPNVFAVQTVVAQPVVVAQQVQLAVVQPVQAFTVLQVAQPVVVRQVVQKVVVRRQFATPVRDFLFGR